MPSDEKPRLLTGDRPTGDLHLGHYVGTLQNRVHLQTAYTCYFIVADLHMLTTKNRPDDIRAAAGNARGLALDAISAGIDPANVTFYLQSAVPEIHEIAGLLQSLVTVARLERLPALKDMARDANIEMSAALLTYPVLQSADILSVRAQAVPVGKDNYAFVEVCRELARRFNSMYGDVFPIPGLIESAVPSLIGTDGKHKMSKSLGNTISLNATRNDVERKIRGMYTDPARIHATSQGTVEGNPVFAWLDAFGQDIAAIDEMKQRYRAGRIGDSAIKAYLSEVVNALLDPMRERREQFSEPGLVDQLLVEGTERVREQTQITVREMKQAMGISGTWNAIRRRAQR